MRTKHRVIDTAQQDHNAAHVIAGNWPAIMAQHSPADLRPIRVRGEVRERRKAG